MKNEKNTDDTNKRKTDNRNIASRYYGYWIF